MLTVLFCNHCGETKMYKEDQAAEKVNTPCKTCLQGTLEIALTVEQGTEIAG